MIQNLLYLWMEHLQKLLYYYHYEMYTFYHSIALGETFLLICWSIDECFKKDSQSVVCSYTFPLAYTFSCLTTWLHL